MLTGLQSPKKTVNMFHNMHFADFPFYKVFEDAIPL